MYCRVRLNRLCIRELRKDFEFPRLKSMWLRTFLPQCKKSKKYQSIFIYLKLNHCKVNLTRIFQCSLFMNTFKTESTALFEQS